MSLLSRLCKGAPLLYLTIVHAWMLPTLFLLYVGGAVGSWVFLATAFSAAATAVSSLFLGRRGGGAWICWNCSTDVGGCVPPCL